MRDPKLDSLFEPLEMNNLKLKNRFFLAPMGTGFTLDQTIDFLKERAKGEVGLINTAEACVHVSGSTGILNELRIDNDDTIKPLSEIAKTVQKAGAKIAIQINHAGRYSPSILTGNQAVAPSPIMSGYTGETPRELTTDEADDLVIAFAEAILRAQKAGFDGVELLSSSGYLISQFLSPLTNKRQDKYGGDAVQRTKFLTSILEEARSRVGPDLNICVKFDAEDGIEGGKTLEDSLLIAPHIVKAGADRLHVWAGWHEATRPMLPMYVPRAAFTYLSAAIKKVVDVPVSTVGRINDPFVAAEILSKDEADLIGLGRALLCDPHFVKKTMEGRINELKKCTACCFCFDSLIMTVRGEQASLKCGINPELGREGEKLIESCEKKKNIIIVGGGPAGMEAARVAAIRGHNVILYESDEKLGGMLNLAYLPPHKEEIKNIVDYYTNQMKLLKINVKTGTTFTKDELDSTKPDSVIIATGAQALIPNMPGINEHEIITALEVLNGTIPEGDNIVIIGGGLIGIETAEYLADKGKNVTVVEMYKIGTDIGATSRWGLISRLRRKVKILNSTKVLAIKEKTVLVNVRDKEQRDLEADAIVLAVGLESVRDLESIIKDTGVDFHIIGSCNEPGQIPQAIEEGFNAGISV